MRFVLLLVATFFLLRSGDSHASGFGWYVCSMPLNTLQESAERIRKEAESQLARSDNGSLRAHLQDEADERILDECEESGSDESPRGFDFYSPDFIAYAESYQQRKGVKGTLFTRFRKPPEFFGIEARPPRPMMYPVYFVLSPKEVQELHEEVATMNRDTHPPEHAHVLRQLEGMLYKTINDLWFSPNTGVKEGDNGERVLIFHGHD